MSWECTHKHSKPSFSLSHGFILPLLSSENLLLTLLNPNPLPGPTPYLISHLSHIIPQGTSPSAPSHAQFHCQSRRDSPAIPSFLPSSFRCQILNLFSPISNFTSFLAIWPWLSSLIFQLVPIGPWAKYSNLISTIIPWGDPT